MDIVKRKSKYTIVGQRFGQLVVLSLDSYVEGHKTKWLCQCDCGNRKAVRNDVLRKGHTCSCGCISRRFGDKNKSWKGYQEIYGGYWTRIQREASQRHLPFSISIQEAWALYLKQERRCALTGDSIGFGHAEKRTASLDRIDSSQGYILGNVQWVTKEVNFAKQALHQKDFISLCHKVSKMHM